ncbi:MAG: peptidase M15 [Bradyrhizobium sp.]|nr:peptidase M15 [Bradyrhizobium sp.]MBI5264553.1 peptidase M15 [Bradyrhizobium sp.]
MNPRRFPTMAALCTTVVLAGWVVTQLAGFGSASIENAGAAVPIEDRRAPSLIADAELPDAAHATMGNAPVIDPVARVDVAKAAEAVTGTATDTTASSNEPKSTIVAALTDPSHMLPHETPPVQAPNVSTSDPIPGGARDGVSSIEILDECLVADICIDRYLWALYQRTPKEDTIKVHDQRKVTVKKKGRTVTVTKSFTRLVDQDFTWKDPKAAERAGKPMMDYVIGGMDRRFKLKLFHTLLAAEEAGLSPGITSAFRDDYRQSIASGLKAASNRSYHGGSLRGGYGHGLAADVVSVNGGTRDERWISSDKLWKWIDAHGKKFGIGRPYLDRDPPHVAPVDGKEYAARRGGTKTQHADHMKKRNRLAVRDDHSVAKRPRAARSSKVRTIQAGSGTPSTTTRAKLQRS